MKARDLVSRISFGALMLGGVLAGCSKPPPVVVVVPPPPPLPPHLGPPPASVCVVAPFHVIDGGMADVAMKISNDGGYCAAAVTTQAGVPFDAPLVPERPAHGMDQVVKYNGRTSVEYSAHPGYVGTDGFTVHLIIAGHPGYTTLHMHIDVVAAPK